MQASPAYTAVAARQSLQRPPVDSQPQTSPARSGWSPAVRAYVQRAFQTDHDVPGIDAATMQEKLRVIISQAAQDGLLEKIDWTTYPLPQDFIMQERNQAASHMARVPQVANMNAHATVENASLAGASTMPLLSSGKKRKSSDMEMLDAGATGSNHPWQTKALRTSLEDRVTGRTKAEKKQKKIDAMHMTSVDKGADALEKRRQRFGYVTPDRFPFISSRDESPAEPAGPLVGTCQTLEKNYFRLTAPPHPSTVRPLPVLEQALDHIRMKWKKEHNYTYACDQLKSLRQDLTVQHIKNDFTVKVYEVHARIALEMADLGEYNQCQTQLRALYRLRLGGRQEEFTAYRILYFLYTCNRTGMNEVLADLTTADKQKPGVRHALQVRSALASGNYHRFFRLYDEAPLMGPYLLDMFVHRERLAAMAAICRTYKPDVSVRFLADELAFHGEQDSEETDVNAGPRECVDFLCRSGGEHLVERRDDGEIRFLTGKAGQLFENARAAAFGKVDIKGQI